MSEDKDNNGFKPTGTPGVSHKSIHVPYEKQRHWTGQLKHEWDAEEAFQRQQEEKRRIESAKNFITQGRERVNNIISYAKANGRNPQTRLESERDYLMRLLEDENYKSDPDVHRQKAIKQQLAYLTATEVTLNISTNVKKATAPFRAFWHKNQDILKPAAIGAGVVGGAYLAGKMYKYFKDKRQKKTQNDKTQ